MLDTNICIQLIKQRPQRLVNKLGRTAAGDVGISSITLAELEYGVAKSGRVERNRDALRKFTSPLEIEAFDQPAAAIYGKIRALLEKKGQTIGSLDMMIAAHAVTLDVTLITNNQTEFKRVPGLKTANWL